MILSVWRALIRAGHWKLRKRIFSEMVRTGILILLNTLQSVPPLKNHRTGLLSLGVHGESREKNARRTDNAADEYLCQSQAFTELFFRYFYELVQQLGFILVSKKVFQNDESVTNRCSNLKNFPACGGPFFSTFSFYSCTWYPFFSTFSFYSCTRYPPNIPNARENVRSRTAEYFSIADCLSKLGQWV